MNFRAKKNPITSREHERRSGPARKKRGVTRGQHDSRARCAQGEALRAKYQRTGGITEKKREKKGGGWKGRANGTWHPKLTKKFRTKCEKRLKKAV